MLLKGTVLPATTSMHATTVRVQEEDEVPWPDWHTVYPLAIIHMYRKGERRTSNFEVHLYRAIW